MSTSRLVEANQIRSWTLPPVQITVDAGFSYIGGPRFQLYGIAGVEQHVFGIADDQHMLQRLVWVQFEGFLPDNQRTYRYAVTETVTSAGATFIYDAATAAVESAITERPDSDFAVANGHLQAHGYKMLY